ncbi:MAG TPA: YggT family protein [Burkholderiaceae bacterium]|nr:YggT family protein [Burkholderiaceae bacterium]
MLLVEVFLMLLHMVAALFGGMLLLRAYMQWLRVGYHNPIAQFVVALTDWAARPLRALVPRSPRWDWASLLAAFLIALAYSSIVDALGGGHGVLGWPWLAPLSIALLVRWALYIVLTLVFVYALISVVNPEAPLAPTLDLLTRPLLAPFRRVMPAVAGFDLSPLAVIVVVQVLLYVLDRAGA